MAIQKITAKIIADGAIIATDIADGSITTAKIADANVTAAKLATGAALPSQSGNTNYYLTTDGTNSVWKAQTALAVANTQLTGSIEATQVGTTVSQLFGMRNRIINGAMEIDQRNAGASVTPTGDAYTLDRWQLSIGVSSKLSVQQSNTAPTGFINSALITTASAYTASAADYLSYCTKIEGLNISDLAWGTANAKTVTLSFQIRSSLTGTFSGALQNGGASRSYPFTFSISSANTWETKSVTIAGDTSGTWLTTNGIGIEVHFNMGSGSDRLGTAGAWNSNWNTGATGSVALVQTNGATFYITGVQLEIGSTATSFERRQYGQELALCQRYCYRVTNTGNTPPFASGVWQTSTLTASFSKLPTTMRATPTISFSSIGDIQYLDRDLAWRPGTSSLVINEAGPDGVNIGCVCSTGSIAGYGTIVEVRGTNGWFQFNAEL